jgi:hypothetical protein
VTFVGGPQYSPIEPVMWGFAAVGTLWAMEQLAVYSTVARQSRRAVAVVWAGLTGLVVVGRTTESVSGLLWVVATTHLLVLGVLIVLSQTEHRRRPAPL